MMNGEAVCSGNVLDHFAESEELSALVAALPHVSTDQISLEMSQERVTGEHYLEPASAANL